MKEAALRESLGGKRPVRATKVKDPLISATRKNVADAIHRGGARDIVVGLHGREWSLWEVGAEDKRRDGSARLGSKSRITGKASCLTVERTLSQGRAVLISTDVSRVCW